MDNVLTPQDIAELKELAGLLPKLKAILEPTNANKPKQVDKWRPKKGQSYWTITAWLTPNDVEWYGDNTDFLAYEFGLVVKTDTQAQEICDYLKQCLLNREQVETFLQNEKRT